MKSGGLCHIVVANTCMFNGTHQRVHKTFCMGSCFYTKQTPNIHLNLFGVDILPVVNNSTFGKLIVVILHVTLVLPYIQHKALSSNGLSTYIILNAAGPPPTPTMYSSTMGTQTQTVWNECNTTTLVVSDAVVAAAVVVATAIVVDTVVAVAVAGYAAEAEVAVVV